MATWNSRGLRGSAFEDLINRTNDRYAECGLALVQKIPTPITPMQFDKDSHQITLAYFEKKSTVDYIGVAQGLPICFEAKESHSDTFALKNIHPHQVSFMEQFERQGGAAFFLVSYSARDRVYFLPFRTLFTFWERMEKGGRKSFRIDELSEDFILTPKLGIMIPYLDKLKEAFGEPVERVFERNLE